MNTLAFTVVSTLKGVNMLEKYEEIKQSNKLLRFLGSYIFVVPLGLLAGVINVFTGVA